MKLENNKERKNGNERKKERKNVKEERSNKKYNQKQMKTKTILVFEAYENIFDLFMHKL